MSMTLTQEKVLARFSNKWGDRFDYSHVIYKGADTKVKIICAHHGEFWLLPWQHSKGIGCYLCGRETTGRKARTKLVKSQDQFVQESRARFGDLYDYSKVVYQQSFSPITIGCREHGDFEIEPARHLHELRGCPTCSSQKSNAEGLWLDSLGLPRDSAHRNINLNIDGRKCLIDGYDPETHTVYEFHGDFWHGNPLIYAPEEVHPLVKKTYGELYEATLEKEQRIRGAGYNLVVMWESDWRSCRSTPSCHLPASC